MLRFLGKRIVPLKLFPAKALVAGSLPKISW